MKNVKNIEILPRFSWKRRGMLFVSTFTMIWLFIEPLGLLTSFEVKINNFGYYYYFGLLLVSGITIFIIEAIYSILGKFHTEFIEFQLLIASKGEKYTIKTPKHLNAKIFIKLLLEDLASDDDKIKYYQEIYDVYLILNKNGNEKKISNVVTLSEAGIENGDLCELHGTIKNDSMNIRFSRRE